MKTRRPSPDELAYYNSYVRPRRKLIHASVIASGFKVVSPEAKALIDEIYAWERANGFIVTHQGVRKIR